MLTDIISADAVENNDFIVEKGKVIGYVYSVDDQVVRIVFDVVDEDGEHFEYHVHPFDDVEIVTNFSDEDSEEVLDSE